MTPDIKSVCDEVVAANLTEAEWLSRPSRSFWRATCFCGVRLHSRHKVAFGFYIPLADGSFLDSLPLPLARVREISAGRVESIAVRLRSRADDDTRGMRRVEIDPFIIETAIIDAINVFVREGLVPRGLMPDALWEPDSELFTFKHRLAAHWANRWRVCWVRDDPPA